MRVEELPWRSPDAFIAQYGSKPWSVLLDSGGPVSERTRWSFFCCSPSATFTGDETGDWARLSAFMPSRTAPNSLPFTGGVIGLASYEAGLALEGIVSRHAPVIPALTLARYDGAYAFDRLQKRLFWSSYCDASQPVSLPECSAPSSRLPHLLFTPDLDRRDFCDAVKEIIARINNGELFQANLTTQFRAACTAPIQANAVYRKLRHVSPAPFGAYFNTPGFALLSASVERFLNMNTSGLIETRPIKGTAPLGVDEKDNIRIARALRQDEKEYAENLMITDLMRNDIGRVSLIGSVHVPALCTVERFTHVHHLVSAVTGQLMNDMTALDLLHATLPPGSVTGAPKHQALKVIDKIERAARGAYCGSLFRIGADGALDSSVIIRSLVLGSGSVTLGAGCGITTLSDPEREYDELCLKAAPLRGMFET